MMVVCVFVATGAVATSYFVSKIQPSEAAVSSWQDIASTAWLNTSDARYASYQGAVGSDYDNAYLIKTEEELAAIGSAQPRMYIKLAPDKGYFDLSGHDWVSVELVGGVDKPTAISIDGQGFQIKNANVIGYNTITLPMDSSIDSTPADDALLTGVGFFGVTSNVNLLDIELVDPTITKIGHYDHYPDGEPQAYAIGTLLGIGHDTFLRSPHIIDPHVTINIIDYDYDYLLSNIMIGGIAGYMYKSTLARGVVNGGIITNDEGGYEAVSLAFGGAVGYNYDSAIINTCTDTNMAEIISREYAYNNRAIGGLVGLTSSTETALIQNNYCLLNSCSHTTIDIYTSGRLYDWGGWYSGIGGIAGVVINDDVVNNYFDGEINIYDLQHTTYAVGILFGFIRDSVLDDTSSTPYSIKHNFYSQSAIEYPAVGYIYDTDIIDYHGAQFSSWSELKDLLNAGTEEVKNVAAAHTDIAEQFKDQPVNVSDWFESDGVDDCGPTGAPIPIRISQPVDITNPNQYVTYNGATQTLSVITKDVAVGARRYRFVLNCTNVSGVNVNAYGDGSGGSITAVYAAGLDGVLGSSDDIERPVAIFSQLTYSCPNLIINAKPITLAPKDKSKEYDGTALALDAEDYDVTAGGTATGEQISSIGYNYSTVAAPVDVGGSNANIASVVIKKGATDTTSNYTVTKSATSKLTITSRPISIRPKYREKVYDGTPLTAIEYEITSSKGVVNSDEIGSVNYTSDNSLVNVGEAASRVSSVTITKKTGGADVSGNYSITKETNLLKITAKPITLKAGDASKVYDGTALTANTYSITAGGLADNETIANADVVYAGTQTNAGSSPSSLTVDIKKDNTVTTGNYNIFYQTGILTVSKRAVTIKPNDRTKEYDGAALTANELTATNLVSNDSVAANYSGAQTDAGSSFSSIEVTAISNTGGDVTANYEITTQTGNLTVTARPISLKPNDATKEYDGESLRPSSYTITSGTLAGSESITNIYFTNDSTQTNAGTKNDAAIETVIIKRGANNVSHNYDIDTSTTGILTVTQRPLTLEPNDATKIYDGTALTANAYSIKAGTLVNGEEITNVSYGGAQTNVGINHATISSVTIKRGENNVSSNYAINTTAIGTLTVTARPITVRPSSAEKVYDGTALTATAYTIQNGSLANGESIVAVSYTGAPIDVGIYDNSGVVIDAIEKDSNHADVTTNYAITYQTGALAITPRPITVTPNSVEKVYDGTALTASTLSATNIAIGDSVTGASYTGSQTNVGSSLSETTITAITNTRGNAINNYTITYNKGTLTVTSRAINLKPSYAEKVYDGTELTATSYTMQSGSLANGESVTNIYYTGSQTNVGESTSQIETVVIKKDGEITNSNYYINIDEVGILKITARPLVLVPNDKSKVYDGTPFAADTYSIEGGSLAEGEHIASVSYIGSQIDVGVGNSSISVVIIQREKNDVTFNYALDIDALGVLAVAAREITVTPKPATKVYDGTPLLATAYDITSGTLAENEMIDGDIYEGEQINVGISSSEIKELAVFNNDEEDVSSNYLINYEPSILEITAREIALKPVDIAKTYDGTPLIANEYEITDGDLAVGDYIETATVTYSGSQTEVGDSSSRVETLAIYNQNGKDMTANYAIKQLVGLLSVAPVIMVPNTGNGALINDNLLTDHVTVWLLIATATTATIIGAMMIWIKVSPRKKKL
ncbi:MAG: hypothetical protein LBQ02_03085 [Candidatus Nomurabacteria bacterium]|jgi:mRNA-degrading endonuclease toxin of MazEF toxin-antitoxin module|nr:hypothetical protein [Candidatus Nomurabacteria bacterium]